jgi:hypothetical protein
MEEMAPTKRDTKKDDGGAMLGLRLDAEDVARLDALTERMLVGSRHALARAALRLGLDAIEADPAVLLGGGVKGRKAPKR